MIPNGAAAVVTFFLFVAPGLTWELLHERKYPAVSTSTFRETARVALLSTIFSGASIGLLALGRFVVPDLLPDVEDWLKPHSDYARVHYRTVAAAAAIEVVLACLLAAGHHAWVTRGQRSRVHAEPLRNVVLHAGVTSSSPVIRTASLRMRDGTVLMGTIALVGHEEARADAEIALAPPLWRAAPGGEPVELGTDWQRVIVPFAEVEELWLSWRPDAHPSRPKRRWWKPWAQPASAQSATAP